MRKIYGFLIAIAALGFTACVNDTTEDLVKTPTSGGGSVTLTAAISDAEVRTELGEKVEGKYLLYWSADDVVAVNGEAVEVAIDEENAAVATLTTSAAAPYNIIYPYTEGLEASQVRFAAVQPYTEGTFAAASAPMYGYAADAASGVGLRHLTGIMRFAVKAAEGEEVTLKSISITTDGDIAGDFTVDCTTGELTPLSGKTSSTITYTFAEGQGALTTTATEFFVTIPAGTYGMFEATFATADGKSMIAKFDGSNIKAGVVREFRDATFINNSNMFLIYDEATLCEFAEHVAAGTFTWEAARVIAPFEVSAATAEAWTSIEGFAGVLDGNNNTISGLVKPLFATTTGTIKNLKLKGAYSVAPGATFGAVAQTAGDKAVIEGCSLVEGSTIAVAGTTTGATTVGGLVGTTVATATLTNLTNGAAVTISANNGEADLYLGGVVGRSACNIENCDNTGAISAVDATLNTYYVGGIIGWLDYTEGAPYTITNCDNSGDVLFDKDSEANIIRFGGVAGFETLFTAVADAGTITYCTNSGAVTYSGTTPTLTGDSCFVGGCFGVVYSKIDHITNGIEENTTAGKVVIDGEVAGVSASNMISFGGLAGQIGDGTLTVAGTNLYNYAPVTYALVNNAHVDRVDTGAIYQLFVGGLAGRSVSTANTTVYRDIMVNYGDLTVAQNSGEPLYIGGVLGSGAGRVRRTYNYGNIDYNVTSADVVHLGGCIGYQYGNRPFDTLNYGDININGVKGTTVATDNLYLGGCIGESTQSLQQSKKTYGSYNEGAITIKDYETSGKVFSGGLAGYVGAGANNNAPSNIGDITIEDCKFGGTLLVAGLVGQTTCPFVGPTGVFDGSSDWVSNSGNITIGNTTVGGNFYVAGCVGYEEEGDIFYGLRNTGTIHIKSTVSVTGNSMIGGIFGTMRAKTVATDGSSHGSNHDFVNEGDIYANHSGARIQVAGIVPVTAEDTSTKKGQPLVNARNEGSLNIGIDPTTGNDAAASNITSYIYISGISAQHQNAGGENWENKGNITIGANVNHTGSQLYCCGVAAYTNKSLATGEIKNSGNVTCKATSAATLFNVAGITGRTVSAGHKAQFINSGNITLNGKQTTESTNGICVGGCIAYYSGGYGNYAHTNTGAVTVTIDAQESIYVGGVVGYNGRSTNNQYIGSHNNSGLVSFTGKSLYDVFVGGVIGAGNGRGDNFATIAFYAKNCKNTGSVVAAKPTCRNLCVGSIGGFVDGKDDGSNEGTEDVRAITDGNVTGTVYFNSDESGKLYGLNAEMTDENGNIVPPGTTNSGW